MRTRMFATVLALAGPLGPMACDKQPEKQESVKTEVKLAEGPAEKKAQADVKADTKTEAKAQPTTADPEDEFSGSAPVDTGPLELATLGLQARGATDARVSEALTGDGVTVLGTTLMATVEVASDDRPKTDVDAKKDAESTYTVGIRGWKAEVLPDGFAATFENEGALGTNYFVNARRSIGGKSYWCATTVASTKEQAAALAFCKSLAQSGS